MYVKAPRPRKVAEPGRLCVRKRMMREGSMVGRTDYATGRAVFVLNLCAVLLEGFFEGWCI